MTKGVGGPYTGELVRERGREGLHSYGTRLYALTGRVKISLSPREYHPVDSNAVNALTRICASGVRNPGDRLSLIPSQQRRFLVSVYSDLSSFRLHCRAREKPPKRTANLKGGKPLGRHISWKRERAGSMIFRRP